MGMNVGTNAQACLVQWLVLHKDWKQSEGLAYSSESHILWTTDWDGPLFMNVFTFKNSYCRAGLHDLRQKRTHILCEVVLDY